MLCVDANLWVYYLDSRLAEHETVRPRMVDALEDRTLFCNAAISMEVVHYLTRQLDESERPVERFLYLDGLEVAALTAGDVEQAADLLHEYPDLGVGGRDASLVAGMERNGVTELWTHETGLKRLGNRLDWLHVEDPAED